MRIRKLTAAVLAVLLLLCAAGCGKYVSHYSATAFVHSNEAKSSFMDYYTFEGRMVFRMRSDGTERLACEASLEEGSVDVICVIGGRETQLFTVTGGDEIALIGDPLPRGTVYVIVESPETSRNGGFRFDLTDAEE